MKLRIALVLPALMLLSACGEETDPRLQIPHADEVRLDLAPGRVRSANLYGWGAPLQQVYITPTVPAAGTPAAAPRPATPSSRSPVCLTPKAG
ncbi:hypothetical protein GDI3878 (plasmid) [Gluconacetobacter diazotrophicus PA1 5]|uniref:Lipoprotein n=1 Tax=Gluconacetobacter diazotrophicus (strain ATCC 49037 / DSM 5601 / CCUG 37298 / CIP 103539 / LMG 7603 / PAl5) TaxID=272568 RepID=A9HSY3_GLUDA|nr:hypothetical protein GDI3878 [Gluconacetobacter diazotrophicus PA1 5]